MRIGKDGTGQDRSEKVRTGQDWSGQVRQVRTGQDWSGQVRIGEDRSRRVRTGQVRIGQDRSERLRTDQDMSG